MFWIIMILACLNWPTPIIIMNSFIEAYDQTAIDFNAIQLKLRDPPKGFTFFLYYQRAASQHTTHLQKLAFTIREEKNWNPDKPEPAKQVVLLFVDLENQLELEQSFFDLKMQLLQTTKTKLIFYSQEEQLVSVLAKARVLGIDLSQVPAALYSPQLHGDLSQHLGWREPMLGDLSLKASVEFQESVKKWITSPGERIDLWQAQISVDPQEGAIYRLDPQSNTFMLLQEKELDQYFISHLAIGHHAQLAANYQAHRKQHSHSLLNRLIFNVESLKQFCCLGSPSLQASTGVLSLIFEDDKHNVQEITKLLTEPQNKRGVASLLFSNIDKFMGMKLDAGRLNDGKLQMAVYESSNQFRVIGSAAGTIRVRLQTPSVFVSVGSACLRLVQPRELKISLWGKAKVLISKDSLEC